MKNTSSRFGTTLAVFLVLLSCISLFKPNFAHGTSLEAQSPAHKNSTSGTKLYPAYLDQPIELKIDGASANYLLMATEKFKSDKGIPEKMRDLGKYHIEIRQDAASAFVSMIVKRDPAKNYTGSETKDGLDVTYVINKKSLVIQKIIGK